MNDQKPTHVYIGRKDCGCVRAVSLDQRSKSTAKQVYAMICDGLIVERMTCEAFDASGGVASLFEDCPHEERQLSLFGKKS